MRNHTTLRDGRDLGHIWVSKGANEAFAHFAEYMFKNHILDAGRIGSFLVGFVTECALRCLRHVSCISFDIEDPTRKDREITCEQVKNFLIGALW